MKYSDHFSTKKTHQSEPIPGKAMVANNAGGFGFEISRKKQLERFLILGTEGGTYYVNAKTLTIDNANNVVECIKRDGNAVLDTILTISDEGRAAKNSPALFALALCTSPKFADADTRRKAFEVLPKVARTSTHLFEFVEYMQHFRGWGKLAQNGVQDWYQKKDSKQLEYQMVKYRQRNGWTHNDVLRLAKPVPVSLSHNQLYGFAKKGVLEEPHEFKLIEGYAKINVVKTASEAAKLIADYKLPLEAVPTEFKNKPVVWEALIGHLPITATIRNLRNMAKYGFMVPFSDASKIVAKRISDQEIIKNGRVHPVQFLNALLNYPTGALRITEGNGWRLSDKEEDKWLVDKDVVEALNQGFGNSFKTVVPSNKRMVLALDVSGSMSWHWCLGMDGVTPMEASAALALITANTEPNHFIGVFSAEFRQFTKIKAGMSIDDAIDALKGVKMGPTNISAPMEFATKVKMPVDIFTCYTDNETWFGRIHPCQALKQYSQASGIDAKFISVSMEANKTTVADPENPNMLDVVGFDTSTPKAISEFAGM